MPKVPPISKRLRDSKMFLVPENERLPERRTLTNASDVSVCAVLISSMLSIGTIFLHNSNPPSQVANSESVAIILSNSSVFNAFLFIYL